MDMKKLALLVAVSAILSITACTNSGNHNGKINPMDSLFENSGSTNINSSPNSTGGLSNDGSLPVYEKIDIDLTTMSSVMVYSEVSNMMNDPGSFVGKIVKVSGPFVPLESTNPDYCYPAIQVQDATACCANGLEFVLYGVPRCTISGGNGYPLYNEEATIVGKFATYIEGYSMYVHLIDAIWLK